MQAVKKPLLGLTGPSGFSDYARKMCEDPEGLASNFVELVHGRWENTRDWLERVDGVVVAGGIDIHPTIYGQDLMAHRGLKKFDLVRDQREMRIVRWCLDNRKPMLAICRGHQLLSVVKRLGDEFVMDLGFGDVVHQPARYDITLAREEPCHAVKFRQPGFIAAQDAKERELIRDVLKEDLGTLGFVNSFHHQGVRFLAKCEKMYAERNILVLATAPTGAGTNAAVRDIIELMVGVGEPWVSVQWHPEYDYDVNTPSMKVVTLFRHLLNGTHPMRAEG